MKYQKSAIGSGGHVCVLSLRTSNEQLDWIPNFTTKFVLSKLLSTFSCFSQFVACARARYVSLLAQNEKLDTNISTIIYKTLKAFPKWKLSTFARTFVSEANEKTETKLLYLSVDSVAHSIINFAVIIIIVIITCSIDQRIYSVHSFSDLLGASNRKFVTFSKFVARVTQVPCARVSSELAKVLDWFIVSFVFSSFFGMIDVRVIFNSYIENKYARNDEDDLGMAKWWDSIERRKFW